MKIKYKINIKEPCEMRHSSMADMGCGKYCFACKETVVDYRQKSNKELLEIIKTNQVSKCGIFNEDQVKAQYVHPLLKISNKIWAILGSLLIGTAALRAENFPSVKTEIKPEIDTDIRPGVIAKQTVLRGNVSKLYNYKPMKNVRISIPGQDIEVYTNKKGEFEIPINVTNSSKIQLEVTFKDYLIHRGSGNTIDIDLVDYMDQALRLTLFKRKNGRKRMPKYYMGFVTVEKSIDVG
ncbi:MAG: hypothetical protein MRY83_17700 [Flavobacteriales bacterium]|nr:hypothetical protein [Flavobacteriales bacterium]